MKYIFHNPMTSKGIIALIFMYEDIISIYLLVTNPLVAAYKPVLLLSKVMRAALGEHVQSRAAGTEAPTSGCSLALNNLDGLQSTNGHLVHTHPHKHTRTHTNTHAHTQTHTHTHKHTRTHIAMA